MRRAKHLKIKGIYFLYRVLQAFGLPVVLLYFALRGLRNRGYWRSLPQRFGFLPRSFRQTGPGAIWLHAVSVGEVFACLELLDRLRAELPNTSLFVSSSTLAGYATASDKLRGKVAGVFYAPVDYVFAVRRVLRAVRPSVVVIAETEIWPNLIREAKRTGAGVTIVNGRISDRAFPRYARLRSLFAAALAGVDSILAQTAGMGERFVAAGAPPERVTEGGNLKYDFAAKPAPAGSPALVFIDSLRPACVWIAASTMPPAEPGDVDEDDAVVNAYSALAARFPHLVLVWAPRKPERFDEAARRLEQAGIPFTRRTALVGEAGGQGRVLLLDTIGELSGLFACADVVFMGGSLARRGGHNILEPALFGKPVVCGPHMENFQAIADEFREAGALVEIGKPGDLGDAVGSLLQDAGSARETGVKALTCAERRRGAVARVVREIRRLHSGGVPLYRPAMPWYALAWLLSRLWIAGGRRKRRKALANRRSLDAPVISIGNITMGGTGKTPCVLLGAELLRDRGRRPGILTRGYGRSSPERQLAIAPGASIRVEISGDEPQIFVRSGLAPVGIGGDRYAAGRLLLKQFEIDVFLLDDGFQHERLSRDVDIVLVDALEPFGRGGVFPVGRLREPVAALARAGVVLITRSDLSDLAPAVENVIRQVNPHAPVFHAGVRPQAWVDNATGARHGLEAPPFGKAAGFCCLGNPDAYRKTLQRLGITLAEWFVFEDHHRYRPHELKRIAEQAAARGASALLTTEKDAVNLCEGWRELLAPLPLYWLQVRMQVEREAEFARELERHLYDSAPHAAR